MREIAQAWWVRISASHMPEQAVGAIVMIPMHAADKTRVALSMLQPRADHPVARDVVSTVYRGLQSPWALCEAKCLGRDMSEHMICQGSSFPEGMSYLHLVFSIEAEEN